jgi:hypothetical protein
MNEQNQTEVHIFRNYIIDELTEREKDIWNYGFDFTDNTILIKRKTGSIIIQCLYCEDRETPVAYIDTSFRLIDRAYTSIEKIADTVLDYVSLLNRMNYDYHNRDFRDALSEAIISAKGAYKGDYPDCRGRSVDVEMKKGCTVWHLSRFSNDCHWRTINTDRFIRIEGVEIDFRYEEGLISFWWPGLKQTSEHKDKMLSFTKAFEYTLERRWEMSFDSFSRYFHPDPSAYQNDFTSTWNLHMSVENYLRKDAELVLSQMGRR